MGARRFAIGLLVLNVLLSTVACQSPLGSSAPLEAPAAVPVMMPAVGPVPDSALSGESGVHVIAKMDSASYAGEFMITELNGAVVTSVLTDYEGQATVNLPPGTYLVGVVTEGVYPQAAPIRVNVPAGRYVDVSFSLNAGVQQ